MKKTLILLIIIMIAGCGKKDTGKDENSAAGTSADMSVEVKELIGIGRVEPESDIISLAAISGGIVRSINRLAGSKVSKNDILVTLDDELEKIKIDQLRSQYLMQQSQKEIEEISLKEAAVKLDNKKKLLSSVENLVEKKAESQQTLDDLTTEVASLELAYESNKVTVSLSEHKLSELSAQIRLAEAEAGRKILRSPFDGTLLDLYVKEGNAVRQFDEYAELAPAGRLTVRSEIDEFFADRISTGLTAEIRYIGSNSAIAKGKIIFISPYLKKKSLFSEKASDQEDRLVREIRILLDEGSDILFNSEVECIIKL